MISRRTLLALIAGTGGLAAVPAWAQSFPNRPIRLIVPFPAGGPTDVMARLIAQRLSATLGQIVVENRPGGGSTLGAKAVALAEPDGHTILIGTAGSVAIGPALFKNIGYDPLKSFAPVAMLANVPYVLIVSPKAPFKTIPELLAYAKANPGRLTFGAPNGAQPHLLIELFKTTTRADIVLVPYKGASTVITDTMGGQIDGGFETTSVLLGHLRERTLRGLAVTSPMRLPYLPDIPTMVESGVAEFVASSWSGILAPAGTAPEIIGKLRAEIIAGLRSSDMTARLETLGAQASFITREEFAAFLAAENRRWGELVVATGAKPE